MRKYLSCAETAKLVRATLKESFPSVKFAVRSSVYSGGASIDIRYENGPTCSQVKAVIGMFEGSYFDGMTDYKGSNFGSLDGQEVRFGADFIFVNRKFTKAFLEGAVETVCKYYGYAMPVITDGYDSAYIVDRLDYEVNRRIMVKVEEISLCDTQKSATLARVGFLGDDGYGYGAVGRLAA
jgi:Large polyvalent protein associated domain 29